jgi:hypothetical protein
MATCKDCLHYEPCYEYGNILDPAHGGVKCDSFKSSADVVEVVRCKDCIFYQPSKITNRAFCDWHRDSFETFADDFCCYGQRKEPE